MNEYNKYIIICQDFDDKVYQDFIQVIASISDEFTLIINSKSDGKKIEIGRFTRAMEPFCTGVEFEKTTWPGMGLGAPSNIYHYKVSTDSIRVLLEHTNSLFGSYNGGSVPEDLSFTKNGNKVMVTTSHEFCATVYPSSEEELNLIRSIQYISPYALVRDKVRI